MAATSTARKTSVHYELYADLARQNAHLRRNNWLHWGVHLTLVAVFLLTMMRPLAAVRVNLDGSPELLNALAPVNAPGPEEAEYVSRSVATHLLELTSGSVQRDLAKAMSLMTANFSRTYQEKVSKDQALGALEKANVRSVLDFDPSRTAIRAEKDRDGRPTKYFVELAGRLRVYRGDVLTVPLAVRYMNIRTTLLVVPRGPKTLSGLLVEWFDKEPVEAPRGGPSVDTNPLSPVPGPPLAPAAQEASQ